MALVPGCSRLPLKWRPSKAARSCPGLRRRSGLWRTASCPPPCARHSWKQGENQCHLSVEFGKKSLFSMSLKFWEMATTPYLVHGLVKTFEECSSFNYISTKCQTLSIMRWCFLVNKGQSLPTSVLHCLHQTQIGFGKNAYCPCHLISGKWQLPLHNSGPSYDFNYILTKCQTFFRWSFLVQGIAQGGNQCHLQCYIIFVKLRIGCGQKIFDHVT